MKQKIWTALTFISLALLLGACSRATSVERRADAATLSSDAEMAMKLIDAAPDSPVGYIQLSSAYIRQARETGNADYNIKAEATIDRALELDKSSVPARKLKATLMLSFHRFADGLEVAKKLQSELPDDPFVYGLLTDANNELGNYDEAVVAVQKMVDLKPNASSYGRVGHVRRLHGDIKGAIEAFKLAARMTDPVDREGQSWCLVEIGNTYWANGKYDDAERAYDEALANFPDYYLALAGKGRVFAARGKFAEAASFLERAQAKHLNLETIFLLSDVYVKLGDDEKARQQIAVAEGGEATLGTANDPHRVALFWADRGVNLDEAFRIAENDYAAQKDIHASDTLAWCLYKKGRFAEAKKLSLEARRLRTSDARILYHAGMIEKGLGNVSEARRLLGSALRLNRAFDLREGEAAEQMLRELS